jgi:hypothetical protein
MTDKVEITAVDLDKVRDTFTLSEKAFFYNSDRTVKTFVWCGDCYYCQSQKTAFWYKETGEAFCIVCRGTTELRTPGMIDMFNQFMKIRKQMFEDPDTFDYEFNKERIKNNYTEYLEIKRLIYSKEYQEIAPLMRQHDVYRVRSKSLSDEDRLFVLIHIYRDRNHHLTADMNAREQFEHFKTWLLEESKKAKERNGYDPHLSRAERRRLLREAKKHI